MYLEVKLPCPPEKENAEAQEDSKPSRSGADGCDRCGRTAPATGDRPGAVCGNTGCRGRTRVRRTHGSGVPGGLGASVRSSAVLVSAFRRVLRSPCLGEREIRCDAGAALATVIGKSGSGPSWAATGPSWAWEGGVRALHPSARRPAEARQPSTRCWRGSAEPCT